MEEAHEIGAILGNAVFLAADAVGEDAARDVRHREHHAEDDRHAGVEAGPELALFTEQRDRQHDRVHRLEVDHQLGAEGRRAVAQHDIAAEAH